jgi:hypothetical protein
MDASVTVDASVTMDAGRADAGDPDKNRVQCGNLAMGGVYCNTGVNCCATRPATSPNFDTFVCGGACTGLTDAPLACDDQNDCTGGQVCCAEFSRVGLGGPKLHKKSACMGPVECRLASSGAGFTQLCDLGGTIVGECGAVRTCQTDALFPGYGICK